VGEKQRALLLALPQLVNATALTG